MDKNSLLEALKKEFPDKNIVCLPEDDPKEIVVELGGTDNESVAMAIIDQSKPHFHRQTEETYTVESGTLRLFVGGKIHILRPCNTFTIPAGKVHWALGAACRVRVTASPPWTPKDHILVEKVS